MIQEQTVLAYEFEGTRYDCGSKLGYLKANVEYGLKHPELAEDFRNYLSGLTADWASQRLIKTGT
jgi:UTP--glucose-1-phosphate uridylyltransferase